MWIVLCIFVFWCIVEIFKFLRERRLFELRKIALKKHLEKLGKIYKYRLYTDSTYIKEKTDD